MNKKITLLSITLLLCCTYVFAQKNKATAPTTSYDQSLFGAMHWRNIGPFRGGRSLAVAGHKDQPNTYYFGATGGGVWKTEDGGNTWLSISDSVFTASSIGAIAVAPNNPNVVYVGTGEAEIRGNISYGDGMYKSDDAGRSWSKIGLDKSFAISTIAVHPNNENTVFACALGNVFKPNAERGLYKSTDGGKNWRLVLSKNDSTGAVNVVFDPQNPNILFASLWQCYRNPYFMSSGGKGSGLYKSTDGGETWQYLSNKVGMPKGILGKISMAVSPVNSKRVWAMIENENGGLYRSDDGGDTWRKLTDEQNLRQRPWYFSQIFADPQDANALYVLNVQFWKSVDGGNKFTTINNQHGDNHDLWIDPNNPKRMILGDDGGAEVTINGGKTWTELDIPTAQFYHVNVDNRFPYRIFGAQQDNSSICIPSRTMGNNIDKSDWYGVAGGEAGYIVPHPTNDNVTFGGEYDGYMSKYNRQTGQSQNISIYPEGSIGHGASTKKYRFQWTYPIVASPHSNNTLYATSQFVHKTTNEGKSWEIISPDLTKNDTTKQLPSGGLITKDNTSIETYCTIFTFAESPVKAGVLWAGTDDGLIHISQNEGKDWLKVTPPTNLLPEWALMSMLAPSEFDAGTCFLAANRYKWADNKPYLLKTTDYGKTWKLITTGIPQNAYCRVIRQDPNHANILYAGTEQGIFISFDTGEHWQPLQLNLPLSPIHDLQVQKNEKDLVVATHGRSFWVLDNLEPIYQLSDKIAKANYWLYAPRHTYRTEGYSYYNKDMQTGENAPTGVQFFYQLKQTPNKELRLQIVTENGDTVTTFSSKKDLKGEPIKEVKEYYTEKDKALPNILPTKAGQNVFVWNMNYADATKIEGEGNFMWTGSVTGPQAVPGKYVAKLLLADSLLIQQTFDIVKDPRIKTTDTEFKEQLTFALKIRDKLSETHQTINDLRKIRQQINTYMGSIEDTLVSKNLKKLSKPIVDTLNRIEDNLVQHRAKAFQDLLNYPIKLNDKLAGIGNAVRSADEPPTQQSYDAYNSITKLIDAEIDLFKLILNQKVPELNKAIQEQQIPRIKLNKKK